MSIARSAIAQFLGGLAVPDVGPQADFGQPRGRLAVPLKNVVEAFGRLLDRRRAFGTVRIEVGLGEAVFHHRRLTQGLFQVGLGLGPGLQHLGALRLPGGQFRGRRQRVQPRLEQPLGLLELLPRLAQQARASASVFRCCSLSLPVMAFAAAMRSIASFPSDSPQATVAVAVAGLSGFSLMNFARYRCDSSINRSWSLASKAVAASARRLRDISRSHTSRTSGGVSGRLARISRYWTAMSP